MSQVTQLTVSIENRPGTIAEVGRCLGKAGVNILSFIGGTAGATGYLQMIVDDAAGAKKALEGAHIPCMEQTVLQVDLPHRPGALGEYCGKLADQKVNINEIYGTTASGSTTGRVVLAVSDIQAASAIQPATAGAGAHN